MNVTNLYNFQKNTVAELQINSYDMNEFVANSLRLIIKDFFVQMAPSFVIVVSARRRRTMNFFLNILQYIFSMVDCMNIQLVFIDHTKPQRIEGPRLLNLFFVDSFDAFLDIDAISYTEDSDTSEYYHIFLMQGDHLVDADMERIFAYCWHNQITNCNIQLQNNRSELFLYTYFPFTPDKCGNTMPQLINQFVGDKWLRLPYFLPKVNNFHGCPIKGVVRHIPPFAFMKDVTETDFEGLEVEMVREIAVVLNFTLVLRDAEDDDRDSPATNGALNMLRDRSVHFALGYYRKRFVLSTNFTTTAPHYQSTLMTVINVRAHILDSFQVLTFPFGPYSWSAIITSVILILFLTRVARSLYSKALRTFSMVSCAFGLPIKDKLKYWHSFVMFTPWVWYTFLLRSIYSSLLYHFFSNDIYHPMPQSLAGAGNQSYISVMNSYTHQDVHDMEFHRRCNHDGKQSIILNSSNEFIALEYLEEHTSENMFAVISQEFLVYYMVMQKKVGMFYIMPETLVQQQLSIYFTKHSFLVHQFDTTIMDLKAMGLFKFWAKRYMDPTLLSNLKLQDDKMIKQEDLLGIYIICGGLHLVSLFTFALEVLSVKIKKLKMFFE